MRVSILLAVLALSVPAVAQVTPEEAAKRLAEKQAARQADRSQMVSITKGELEDLRAEVAALRAELAKTKTTATAQAAAPAVKLVPKIAVGVTKEELARFVQVHKAEYEVTSQAPDPAAPPAQAGQPAPEKFVIVHKTRHKVYTGVGTNGVARVAEYHEEMRPDTEITAHVLNNRVSSVEEAKAPMQRDEIPPR